MQRVMSELLNYLSEYQTTDLHLVMYGKYPTSFYTLPINLTIHKPEFIFDERKRFSQTIRTIFFIRKTIKKIKPESILSFGELWNSLVIISLAGTGFAVYISDRCQPTRQFGFFHSFLRKILYPRSKGIITQTSEAKEIYFRKFKHPNITTIGNPIRLPIDNKKNYDRESAILTVGRLIQTKHHDRLIAMFASLNAPDWKLNIVGGNSLKQNTYSKLVSQVIDSGLSEKVILTGEVKNVEDFYQNSRIFAFTSSSEGFPNVILEALVNGLPVVAYDCTTGPAELIIDGYNGFLVPLHDELTFIQRLQSMIDQPELLQKLSSNASISVNRFESTLIGRKYYEFITSHLST